MHALRHGAKFKLITVGLSATIGASAERVWFALTDPSERLAWDERILGRVELSGAKSRGGSARSLRARRSAHNSKNETPNITKWRFRLGGIPLVMRDETLTSVPYERLVSRISIGSMHFDQTVTLYREDNETGPRTRVAMKQVARNRIAIVGEVVERLDVQKIVIEYVDTTLRLIQKHCEADA